MSLREDFVLIRDMFDAAKEAISFVDGKTRRDLDQDRKLVLSLVHLVEIIGEAAGKVNRKFQELHSEIPWRVMAGMRNRLVHAYFDIDIDRVWDTVKDDLPPLIDKLGKIISSGK